MNRSAVSHLVICSLLFIAMPLLLACQPQGARQVSAQAPTMNLSEVQSGLKRLGLYKGAVDGISGPKTRAAIRAFERSNRLPETGRPSRDLELRLRVALADGSEDGAATQVAARTPSKGAPLSSARRVVRSQFWPAKLSQVDLNGDGLMDVIAAAEYESGRCGAQACSHMVLMNRGSGFDVVVENALAIDLVAARSRTRGYRDLGGIGHGGTAFRGIWDGRRYKFVN